MSDLSKMLVGTGVPGAKAVRSAFPNGKVEWRIVRDVTDDLGMRHLFLRQYLRPSKSTTEEPVEILGAEIGIHYRNGKPFIVFGTQAIDPATLNRVVISSREEAYRAAIEGLASGLDTGLEVANLPPGLVADQIQATRLVLHPHSDVAGLRYVWEAPVSSVERGPFKAYVDAETGALLGLESQRIEGNCTPEQPSSPVSALAYTENGCTHSRTLVATPANDKLPVFTHEAYRPAGNGIPAIEMYFGLWSWEPGYSTYMCPGKSYGLVPLKTVGGAATYDDWSEIASIPGRAAGDAGWNTYLTMYTLKSLFNRNGWDGYGSTARIFVDDLGSAYNNGRWVVEPTYDLAIANSIGIGRKSGPYYENTFAVCLDFVAHEWGHGVVFSSANMPYSGVQAELHEGFADFLGYAVEWAQQPAGSGCERAEWSFGEDNRYPPLRSAQEDDGVGGTSFHKDDPVGNPADPHQAGNRLGVAYRLLAEGGTNPVCSRLGTLSGCDVSVAAQGLTKADRILYRVLAFYATSATSWSDLGVFATGAAFDLYSRCGACYNHYDAAAEQKAASDAFTAIGYPGPGAIWECDCPVAQ